MFYLQLFFVKYWKFENGLNYVRFETFILNADKTSRELFMRGELYRTIKTFHLRRQLTVAANKMIVLISYTSNFHSWFLGT